MSHALALLALGAATVGLARLRAHAAPEPAYDWPIWAYRIALAIREHLTLKNPT